MMIEKEQQYLSGLAEYYGSSPEAQRLINASNEGSDIQDSGTKELLQNARFKMRLLSVVFYNAHGHPVDFISIDNSYDPVEQMGQKTERPFYRLMHSNHDFEWEYVEQYSEKYMRMDHSPKLILWRKIESSTDHKPIGVVAVSVDVRKLLLTDMNQELNRSVMLLTDDGKIAVDKSDFNLSQHTIDRILLNPDDTGGKISVESPDDQQPYEIYFKQCVSAPFIACTIDSGELSIWNKSSIAIYAIGLISCFALVMLPMAWFSTRVLVKPLKKLSESMIQFSKGDYSAEVDFKYADEIGQLGQLFNTMVNDNRRLVEEKYILELREKEAELSALQTQIDPHFLYNMINSIYWSALKNGDESTADIAYTVGQFFRLSLNRGSDMMTVRRCIDLVRCYLELQKKRFGERIRWNIEVEQEAWDVIIPKLTLQPIVENSIIHGMNGEINQLQVDIAIGLTTDKSQIWIEIRDNGVGIPEHILSLLPDKLDEFADQKNRTKSTGTGFAIKNINERLRILYKDNYTFKIESKLGVGVKVFIQIPCQTMTEMGEING